MTIEQVKALPLGTAVMVNRTGPRWPEVLKGQRLEHTQILNDSCITLHCSGHWDYVYTDAAYEREYEQC